jgi:DNA primase catalytic core
MATEGRLDSVVQALAASVGIVELTERLGIPVKRVGKSIKAQCVFHTDTNPSMILYDESGSDRQHYHCFVCNKSADIFKLVQENKGLSFPKAVEWLAQSYGIPFPRQSKTRLPPPNENEVSAESVSGYERALTIFRSHQEASQLISWLKKRKLASAKLPDAELFFVKPNTLTTAIAEKSINYGASRELLGCIEDLRLIRTDRSAERSAGEGPQDTYLHLGKRYRDFFYDERILFPIQDLDGRVNGFAGRKVDDTTKAPKYLYTPGLPKSKILYRAHNAFARIKLQTQKENQYRTLYLCEGLLDVLRLESLGLPAVGLLGSQLSEHQCQLLINLARNMPNGQSLRLMVFLDRDKAGYRGAAALLKDLFELDENLTIAPVFVWPSKQDIQVGYVDTPKDPDELLHLCDNLSEALDLMMKWSRPPVLALLAAELGVSPDEILDDDEWLLLSLSRRYQASLAVKKLARGLIERLLDVPDALETRGRWREDFISYVSQSNIAEHFSRQSKSLTLNDDDARLNLARDLAESGTRRGELPTDVAAWRRIDIAATAFNEGIKARLQQRDFRPMEPFDAVYVSRGFGNAEHRLKTMACPEDLIVQQYLINELLTERFDDNSESPFSYSIPAVRYDRRTKRTRTTGERGDSEITDTLSFAYQIDMDVLERRQPPGESGMFRPYFDCWRDFIHSITKQSKHMPQVHMVRLDVKRYYDRLRKSVVRDSLRQPIDNAYQKLNDKTAFARWFNPYDSDNERHQASLDWILDQSFDYTYYHPGTGEVTKAEGHNQGIPQGPVLSAWLGSVALFPMDAALRTKLKIYNTEGQNRVGYARYVDDIVLLADSEDLLGVLRATAEDIARELHMELVAKENPPPMSVDDFAQHLTEGRALAVSGPIGEIALLPAGDGDLGWYTLSAEPPKRYAALQLLRDQHLYTSPVKRVLNQIRTALRAEDLRPSELGKAARWLWYCAASQFSTNELRVDELFEKYWEGWDFVCSGTFWALDPEKNSWDDPAFYALEGIEKLLESAHWGVESLNPEEDHNRTQRIAGLAKVARSHEFIQKFITLEADQAPMKWGIGVSRMQRMFWQRASSTRWKAAQLCPGSLHNDVDLRPIETDRLSKSIQASLRRALLTDAETCSVIPDVIAQRGQDDTSANFLRDAILWLHEIFIRLGAKEYTKVAGPPDIDPLEEISAGLDEIILRLRASGTPTHNQAVVFSLLLSFLRPKNRINPADIEGLTVDLEEVKYSALSTFIAICPRPKVIAHLALREHLLPQDSNNSTYTVLPPLPGIPSSGLLSIVCKRVDGGISGSHDIDCIQWITVKRSTDENEQEIDRQAPTILAAGTSKEVEKLALAWEEKPSADISYSVAAWNQKWPANIYLSPPNPSPLIQQLRWAADVYESLAKLNFQATASLENDDGPFEYVAAWPYLVASHWPDKTVDSVPGIALVCAPVSSVKVSGLAFIRDGNRGLKTYDIPKEDGQFWRSGVALTDVLGFRDELDKYSPLKLPEDKSSENYSPSRYLLRNVLRKLRGHYYRGEYLPRHRDKPYLPATLARSLQLLRAYPSTSDLKTGLAYVLACDMETRAMAGRIQDNYDLNLQGLLSDFLERNAREVTRRIPLEWTADLPENSPSSNILDGRLAVQAWQQLTAKLEGLSGPNDLSWFALIQGLRIVTITARLRALTFELEANADGEYWTFPVEIDLSAVWEIENAALCSDRPTDTFDKLAMRFAEAVAEGRSQSGFEFITPLGWLALVSARTGLLDTGKSRSPDLHWEFFEQERIKALAQNLARTRIIPVDDNEVQQVDWPFEHMPRQEEGKADTLSMHDVLMLLESIDSRCGLKVIARIEATWRLEPKAKRFTDSASDTWMFAPWQIALTDGFEPEQIDRDGRVLRIWSETRDRAGKLLAVSARGDRLAKLLGSLPAQRSDGVRAERVTETQRTATEPSFPGQKADQILPHSTSAATDSEQLAEGEETKGLRLMETGAHVTRIQNEWKEIQSLAWKKRSSKNDGHVRVAFMQWRVDNSYRHPMFDLAIPKYAEHLNFSSGENSGLLIDAIDAAKDRDSHAQWRASEMLPSWAEYRRQRFLGSCTK